MCITVHGIIPVGPNKFHFLLLYYKNLKEKENKEKI